MSVYRESGIRCFSQTRVGHPFFKYLSYQYLVVCDLNLVVGRNIQNTRRHFAPMCAIKQIAAQRTFPTTSQSRIYEASAEKEKQREMNEKRKTKTKKQTKIK